MLVTNLVTADRFNVRLNGQSLAGEPAVREFGNRITPYEGQWLEISLRQYRPRAGENTLEVSLDRRAPRLEGGVTVEEVEIVIDYGTYA